MIERPLVGGPTIVGSPGRIAALKKQVAGTVITHDEYDVALEALLFCGEFTQVDTTQPILWDFKLYRRFPLAFAQAVFADLPDPAGFRPGWTQTSS